MAGPNYKPSRISFLDTEELAAHILGLDPDEVDANEIEEALEEQIFHMDDGCTGAFQTIVERLLPLIDIGESPMTKDVFKGFSKDEGNGRKLWLVKEKIEFEEPDDS